jgi:KDO2-lipid IV(A) lauroyltransferase
MTVHPLGGDGVMSALAEHLNRGGLVCLPAERDLSKRGVPVTLFGEPTRMPAGSAMLSLRTGAPLIPVTLSCSKEENLRRLATPQRAVLSKLTDLELVESILETDAI